MAEPNDDKQLEEYIQNLLKNYSAPFSEDDRRQLVEAYYHLKVHDSTSVVSLKHILKNKTVYIIVISIAGIILFIYLFAQFFPSENKNTNYSSHPLDISDTQAVFTSTASAQKATVSKDSTLTPDKHTRASVSAASNTLSVGTSTQSATTSAQPSLSKDSVFAAVQSDSTDHLSKPAKKKKRKRKSENISSEENTLIEPKEPVLNPSEKEEE